MPSTPRSDRPRTIDDVLADIRQDEARQRADLLAAIKVVHAAGPTLTLPANFSPGRTGRAPGSVARYSPSGRFIGWWREGQTAGRPNRRMPLEIDLDRGLEAYLQSLRAAFSKSEHAKILGQRSGAARADSGLTPRIVLAWDVLAQAQVPRHHRPKRIARDLGCSVKYARDVIRRHLKNAA